MTQAAVQSDSVTRNKGAELFEQANSEYDAGRYSKALALFEQAVTEGASSEVVFNNMGASLDALGRNAEAARCYRKATSTNSSYELAWHNLGNSLFIQELYPGAAQAYAQASSLNPDRLENWSGLAASYTKLGKSKKAAAAAGALSRFADKNPSVLLLQTDLYLDADLTGEALTSCKGYISKLPGSVEGYAHLGSVHHERGEYPKAIEAFEQALKIAPADKESWNNLGYTYFCSGVLDEALECFDKALEIDPSYKHAWYNKGYAYHGADLLEQAVDCYRRAIAIDPDDRVLWNNYGNALYNLGKYAESIPKFVEALAVDPDYEIAWNNIGNALEKMGEYVAAIPYHDRSLEISPDFDYALYAKGVCKSHTGDPEIGYDLVIESLDLNPSYDEAWKARSRIAGQLGRWDEALVSIEESLALNPEFDEGWRERGEILLAMGDPEAAHASFEMCLLCLSNARMDTVSGLSSVIRRGEVLARLGRFDEALANLETVLLTGKMDAASLPKLLEIRRFLNSMQLPKSVRDAADRCGDCKALLDYAAFLLDAGDAAGAEEVLSRAPHSEEDADRLLLLKARALAQRGDMDAADVLLRSAGRGHRADASKLRGDLAEARGDHAGASAAYKRALEEAPSDACVAVALARAQLRSGDPRAALRTADVALGIDARDWEPHKIRADALRALGLHDKADSELWKAKELLSASGLGHDETVDVVKG
ncbi:MAG: hypothetical protein A3K67_01790 [Euryarchaeota archaeon RBG_16_62_10]|nr:MAG: hypothetical protein A3K67_01790 [Euryarchaeota archaeon RBG_16_62_10]